MVPTNTMHCSTPSMFSVHARGWLTIFLLILAASLSGCRNNVSTEDQAAAMAGAKSGGKSGNSFLIVDCLLPGQVKKLGGNLTYITQRRPIKTSASDCEIRGGEYVAYDRSNYSTALKIWLPLAQEGDAKAQSYVGEIYEKGLGLQPDYQLAAHWYRKAADQGFSRAQINLGHLYEMGLGVPADQQKALNFYRLASGISSDQLLFASTLSTDYVTRSKYETVKDKLSEQRRQTAQLQRQFDSVSATLNTQNSALRSAQQQLVSTQDQLQDVIANQAVTAPQAHDEDAKWLSQIQQLEEQQQILEREIVQLNQKNQALKRDQSRMQEQVAAAAQSRLENQRQLRKLQADLAGSKAELSASEQTLANAQNALASAKSETASVTPQISKLQRELKLKQQAFNEQQRAYEKLQSESNKQKLLLEQSIQSLAAKSSQLESTTHKLDRDRAALESTLFASNSQSAELQRQLLLSRAALEIEKNKREQALAAQDKTYQAELAQRQTALFELREKLERQNSLVSQKERQIQALQDQSSQFQNDLAAATQARQDNQHQLGKLQTDLATSKADLSASEQALAELQNALASAKAETATITPQIAQLQSELQLKVQAFNDQRRAFESLQAENNKQKLRLEKSVQDLAAKSAQLEATNDRLDRDRAALEETLLESNSQSAELQRQLLLSRAALEIEKTKREQELAAQDQAYRAQLAERQASLEKLSDRLERQNSLVNEQKQRIQSLEEQSNRYQSELAKARKEQAQQLAAADIPPRIEIIEPPVVLTRSIPTVKLKADQDVRDIIGKVSASAGLMSLIVNGEAVTPQNNNLFRSKIPIAGDVTPVDIVAIDNQGRRAALTFSFVADEARKAANAAELSPVEIVSREKKSFKVDWKMGNYHALIIGNNDYRHLSTLVTAVNDARETEELLRTKYGFKTHLLLNADRYQILSALNKLRESLKEQDNLLIYYAGHGKMDEVNERGYWLPVDAEANNSANWISNTAITDILNAIPAKHILVVADSCYSGTLAPTPLARMDSEIPAELRKEWVEVMSDTRARITLTSGGLEPVLDGGGGDHSIFAKAFIEALRENDQLLEGYSLYAQVLDRMTADSVLLAQMETPQYSPIHLAGHESGEFFFNPN